MGGLLSRQPKAREREHEPQENSKPEKQDSIFYMGRPRSRSFIVGENVLSVLLGVLVIVFALLVCMLMLCCACM